MRASGWYRWVFVVVLAVAGCGGGQAAPTPAPAGPVCQEDLCLHERFVPFYLEHRRLLGAPISGPLRYRERLVQYVQAGRLEYVPENAPGYEVGLAYLAEETCGRQPPLHYAGVPSYLDGSRRYFASTGQALEGEFLEFIEANGGIGFFGEPISGQRRVGDETVQDFVRVQVRRDAGGSFYLAALGPVVMAGATPPPGLCPSVPADDPDAQPRQPDGGEDDR